MRLYFQLSKTIATTNFTICRLLPILFWNIVAENSLASMLKIAHNVANLLHMDSNMSNR